MTQPQSDLESDGEDEFETLHSISLDSLTFSTQFEGELSRRECERKARTELIEAIRSGEVTPQWNTTVRDPETRERHKEMDEALRCEGCERVTMADKREIYVDDGISFICPTCVEEVKSRCNQCGLTEGELGDDERITVRFRRHRGSTFSEFCCPDCLEKEGGE